MKDCSHHGDVVFTSSRCRVHVLSRNARSLAHNFLARAPDQITTALKTQESSLTQLSIVENPFFFLDKFQFLFHYDLVDRELVFCSPQIHGNEPTPS